ncbi:MAG: 4-hydroxy-tetrahydrodipicolinate synthase [Pseudobdellovibrionaceae bacterium]
MKNFKATMTALITPFKQGMVDFSSLENLIKYQIKNGIEGFIINGTTAESPTLTKGEVEDIFKFTRSMVGPQFPLIIGTGSNSTTKTEEYSEAAEALGADAVLVVVPYYNKPPQRGLVKHFTEVAKSVSIPVILYNVPGRTITELSLESIRELSQVQNIIGIKEASGNIEFASEIKKKCGPEFILLSGDDGTYVDFLKIGGQGVVSVATHIIPKEMVQWKRLVAEGKYEAALLQAQKYRSLINYLFVESNPIPVKMALYYMGIIHSPELRLPLVSMTDDLAEQMKNEMKALEVI